MTQAAPPRLRWDLEMVDALMKDQDWNRKQLALELGMNYTIFNVWQKQGFPATGAVHRLLDYVAERVGFTP